MKWPDIKFPPINLWTIPRIKMNEYNYYEFSIIQYMIKHAIQHGLETEVILQFANELRNGEKDFEKAANNAMHEWDI